MGTVNHVTHGFGPVIDSDSEILILGSFPSVKSREISFYYGHPQNRFWAILEAIFQHPPFRSVDEKVHSCHLHHIALYDVIEECDIIGSSDLSIKNPIPSKLFDLCAQSKIRKVILNGKKAEQIFQKYFPNGLGPEIEVRCVPSSSPANAAWTLPRLIESWKLAFR